MIKSRFFYCIILLLIINSLGACDSKDTKAQKNNNDNGDQNTPALSLEINDQRIFQTIDNFGASDAWSTQFIGKWPPAKKEAMATLLFGKEMDEEGNPEGIGLSLWRFNVGAGSAQQGENSGIRDEWRRAESFLEPNGEYNWDRQAGQVWFAQAAKERGVENLLVFSNSPPVNMTRNGKAYANNGNSNLAQENYQNFGAFLATVTEGLQSKGLEVNYISPVNEPQWDWSDGGQEGTPFWNNEIAGIVKALNKELKAKNLSAKIDIPEAAQINYLYEEGNKEGRSNLIQDFFVDNSPNYVGDLEHVSQSISGHSYFTTSPYSNLVQHREKLASAVNEVPDLKYWMSEYCILGDNDGEIEGNGRDLGITPALYIAKVIHSDLAIAQAVAWHWWLAISPYDYKDGLVYVDHQKNDGNFYESKMLWALGNYSRFIRPGYQRIDISAEGQENRGEDFLFSAYKNPETQELVVVIVNANNTDVSVNLQGVQTNKLREAKVYVTSSQKDLERQLTREEEDFKVPARSITTITF